MTPRLLRPYPIRKVTAAVACTVPFLWFFGQILKDRILPLNLFYYLPSLLCFLSGCLGFYFAGQERRILRWAILLIGFLALGKVLIFDIQYTWIETYPNEAIQLIHWNTSSGRFGPEILIHALRKQHPDLFLLSEAPPDLDIQEIVRAIFKNGYWFRTDGMAIASRFPIEPLERLELPDGRGWSVRIETPTSSFDLLAVDLRANLLVSRKTDLDFITTWIENRTAKSPLIVVGDFNTPRDSVHFEGFRKNLRNAYEEVGHGWPYSWPFPIPVLQIDHTWYNEKALPLDHQYSFSFGSDHLIQKFAFEISPEIGVLTEGE